MANINNHPIRIRHIAYAFLLLGVLLFIDHLVDPSANGEESLWSPLIMVISAVAFFVVDYWSNRKYPGGNQPKNDETDGKDDPHIQRANDDAQSEILRLKDRVQELERTLESRNATHTPDGTNGGSEKDSALDPGFLEELEASDPKGSDPGIAGDFTPIGGSKAQTPPPKSHTDPNTPQ